MGKLSSYAELAPSGIAADDKVPVIDTSATANKYIQASNLLEAIFLAASSKLLDTNGNEILIGGTTASAVNEVTLTNAATGTDPLFAASGGDTNIGLDLAGKGTGPVRSRSPWMKKATQTATADTATITAAQVLTGILDATPTAAAAYALPTAALLVGAILGARVGDTFDLLINNQSGGANTITVSAGAGGTAKGTLTVAQNVVRRFTFTLTNVGGGTEAYTVYGQ